MTHLKTKKVGQVAPSYPQKKEAREEVANGSLQRKKETNPKVDGETHLPSLPRQIGEPSSQSTKLKEAVRETNE